jgi:hypothetical protein
MARASCRRRIEPTEDWEQLELFVCGPSGGTTSLSALHGEGCRESGQSGAAVVVNAGT